MGAPKQKWTAEEEEALRAGVRKHGPSKWVSILKDPDFSCLLSTRSNVDLKDKWRNLSVSATGQGSREKIKMPKSKALTYPMSSQSPAASTQQSVGASTVADHTDKSENKKNNPRYGSMILEALSVLKDPDGTEIVAIFNFVKSILQQRHEVPSNFRRLLSSKLRRLVGQNKIEKGLKGYRLKESSSGKSFAPRQKDSVNRRRVSQGSFAKHIDPIEEAAKIAAYRISDSEAKAFLASEAIKEAEKVSKMAEESDSLLQLAKEIYQQCMQGKIYQIAREQHQLGNLSAALHSHAC